MVKADIVRQVRLETGLQQGEAEELVNETLEIMRQCLESGEEVLISGFGKFELKDKPPRPGRDPKSGKEYSIKARRVIAFLSSKIWRKELNGKS